MALTSPDTAEALISGVEEKLLALRPGGVTNYDSWAAHLREAVAAAPSSLHSVRLDPAARPPPTAAYPPPPPLSSLATRHDQPRPGPLSAAHPAPPCLSVQVLLVTDGGATQRDTFVASIEAIGAMPGVGFFQVSAAAPRPRCLPPPAAYLPLATRGLRRGSGTRACDTAAFLLLCTARLVTAV